MSGIWKKRLLIIGAGVLILIGSSVGSAVVTRMGGIVSASVPNSIEWRGFYSPHNPATLEGGFHLWPISIGYQKKPQFRPLSGFDDSYWKEQEQRRQREQDQWQRQEELDGLRRDFDRQRDQDKWEQRDLYRSYP